MTTTTSSIGRLEEVSVNSRESTTTTTAYYGGVALSVNGALSYLLSDGPGSVTAAVSTSSGAVTATQLYSPYGSVRYTSGTLPTSYGYTGQRADAATGLDYYNARYYDPIAGQFTSADTTLAGGLNRYAYVGGNPETFVDPSGHLLVESGTEVNGLPDVGPTGTGTPNIGPLIGAIGATLVAFGVWVHSQFASSPASVHRPVNVLARSQSNAMATWNAYVLSPSHAVNRGVWSAHGFGTSAQDTGSSGSDLSRSADVTNSESDAGSTPEPAPEPATDGAGARQGGRGSGRWLYHGTRSLFDRFDVSAANTNQVGRTLELGLGIYLTDDPTRAYQYAGGDKRNAYIYRAWAPDDLLSRLPTSIISTNTSPQWVITNQADADILNQTIERATALDWFLRDPWKER